MKTFLVQAYNLRGHLEAYYVDAASMDEAWEQTQNNRRVSFVQSAQLLTEPVPNGTYRTTERQEEHG